MGIMHVQHYRFAVAAEFWDHAARNLNSCFRYLFRTEKDLPMWCHCPRLQYLAKPSVRYVDILDRHVSYSTNGRQFLRRVTRTSTMNIPFNQIIYISPSNNGITCSRSKLNCYLPGTIYCDFSLRSFPGEDRLRLSSSITWYLANLPSADSLSGIIGICRRMKKIRQNAAGDAAFGISSERSLRR